jgi:hypothetical protein
METQTQSPIASITFRHNCDFGIRQYHDYLFAGWLHMRADQRDIHFDEVEPVKPMYLEINKSHEDLILEKYQLVTEERFLQMLYLLIIEPDAGKEYLKYALNKKNVYGFLLDTPEKQLSITLRWQLEDGDKYQKDGWRLSAEVFNTYVREYDTVWGGTTLLY